MGTIIVAGASFVVAWFNFLKKKIEEYANIHRQKDIEINDLKNGWRKRMEDRLDRIEVYMEKERNKDA